MVEEERLRNRSFVTGEGMMRRLAIFLLPVIVLIFFLTASGHFGYTPDDTYIYLRFAENLVHGNGISYNAGTPTYGMTSPLWLFIVALGGRIGADLPLAAKGIDLLLASLSIIVFYFLAREVIREPGTAMIATVVFSVNAWLIRWAGTGMETSLAVCLTLGAFLYCFRNEYLVSMVLAGLLALVRPEGCVMGPVILVDFFFNSVDKRRALRRVVWLLAAYGVVVVPWLIYALCTFGTIMPNTARAKADPNPVFADYLNSAWSQIKVVGFTEGVLVVVLFGATIALVRILRNPERKEERTFLLRYGIVGGLWGMVLPCIFLSSGVQIVSRYLLPVIPMVTIFAFSHLFRSVWNERLFRWVPTIVIAVAVLAALQNQIGYWKAVKPGVDQFEESMEGSVIPIGRWLDKNTMPTDTIMAWDIGALGYYSHRPILDAFGLVTPKMIPIIHGGVTPERIMKEGLYRTVCRASYIVCRSPVPDQWKSNPDLVTVMIRSFDQMGLDAGQRMYYTVYKVTPHP